MNAALSVRNNSVPRGVKKSLKCPLIFDFFPKRASKSASFAFLELSGMPFFVPVEFALFLKIES